MTSFLQCVGNLLLSTTANRVLRLVLGGVFVVSGALKLADPAAFAHIIREYQLLPGLLLAPAALGLPAVEVLVGTGLVFNIRGALAAVTTLLALFIFVLWYGILHDLHIDCGCFGPEELAEQNSLRQAFVRDLWLLATAAYLYLARWRRSTLRPRSVFQHINNFIGDNS